jgi:hypothetical protein
LCWVCGVRIGGTQGSSAPAITRPRGRAGAGPGQGRASGRGLGSFPGALVSWPAGLAQPRLLERISGLGTCPLGTPRTPGPGDQRWAAVAEGGGPRALPRTTERGRPRRAAPRRPCPPLPSPPRPARAPAPSWVVGSCPDLSLGSNCSAGVTSLAQTCLATVHRAQLCVCAYMHVYMCVTRVHVRVGLSAGCWLVCTHADVHLAVSSATPALCECASCKAGPGQATFHCQLWAGSVHCVCCAARVESPSNPPTPGSPSQPFSCLQLLSALHSLHPQLSHGAQSCDFWVNMAWGT